MAFMLKHWKEPPSASLAHADQPPLILALPREGPLRFRLSETPISGRGHIGPTEPLTHVHGLHIWIVERAEISAWPMFVVFFGAISLAPMSVDLPFHPKRVC